MPNKDYILFLDLETTGSSLDEGDEIIEIGLVLLNSKTLDEVDAVQFLISPGEVASERLTNNDVVRDMHERNGLLEDLLYTAATSEQVDVAIDGWLRMKVPGNDHIPYGGSGVSHFDRPFINKFLPKLSKRITYWSLDVGAARRVHDLADGQSRWPNPEDKTHRALDDARFHADELRYAVSVFGAYKAWYLAG